MERLFEWEKCWDINGDITDLLDQFVVPMDLSQAIILEQAGFTSYDLNRLHFIKYDEYTICQAQTAKGMRFFFGSIMDGLYQFWEETTLEEVIKFAEEKMK